MLALFRRKLPMLTVFALLLATAGLSACNTMEGLGEDVSKAGEATTDAAKSAQQ